MKKVTDEGLAEQQVALARTFSPTRGCHDARFRHFLVGEDHPESEAVRFHSDVTTHGCCNTMGWPQDEHYANGRLVSGKDFTADVRWSPPRTRADWFGSEFKPLWHTTHTIERTDSMDRNKDSCVRASGIVPKHIDLICGIANREDTFILFRPVNPNSTSLIAEGFGTKGLDIHSKSSDWGPQAGFICENQLLSKADTQQGIEKGNDDAHHSLHEEGTRVGRFPLIVTKDRIAELTEVAKGKKPLFRTAGSWSGTTAMRVNVTPTRALGSKDGVVELGLVDFGDRALFMQGLSKALRDECERSFSSMISKLPALSTGYLVVYRLPNQSFSPVFALGYIESGLPVTADYDIFAICPNFNLSRGKFLWKKVTAKVLGKSESSANWTGLMAAAKQGLGHEERNQVNGQMGRITTFQQKIKTLINTACNGVTNPVVHHGTEMDNTQFPEQDQRIVVITPAGGIGVTRDWNEVQNVGQDILKLGYVFYRNRCYVASEQQQNMNKGKKFYLGQGEKNPSELIGNGKSFVWNPEVSQDLKVLLPTDAKG